MGGRASCIIEDAFDVATTGQVIGGRTFSSENNYDKNMQYGKATFSDYIDNNAQTIDFNGFKPFLANLAAAIADYDVRRQIP